MTKERQLIDTHCHPYTEDFDKDQTEIVTRTIESGIDRLLLPNIDTNSIERMHHFCDKYPDLAIPMMGLHPTSVDENYSAQLDAIENCLGKRAYCAIGEIGMDLYWDKTHAKEQEIVLEEQLLWAIDLDLPVSLHVRSAYRETLEVIHKVGANKLTGVFHCFSGNKEELKEVLALKNFKLGIGGVITFKNSGLAETLQNAKIEDILLETDAPYLAPTPHRGKRNEPYFIWDSAQKVAECFDLSLSETVKKTRNNAIELFKLYNFSSKL
ncbi:MAG: TatD family hydrolase [Massilibacteroides sp.]|nr:TatD family hydrolase [Massilibacteroides sp.]